MRKIILSFCALFAFIINAKAQVLISASDLKGTKWQHQSDYLKGSSSYDEYNEGEIITHYGGECIMYVYYLSDYIDTKFDWSKVGQNTKGRYLIQIYPKTGSIMCFSIQSFSKINGEMVLITESGGLSRVSNTYYLMPIDSVRHPRTFVGNGW